MTLSFYTVSVDSGRRVATGLDRPKAGIRPRLQVFRTAVLLLGGVAEEIQAECLR